MKRKLVKTNDGSYTLYVPELNEHYHSIHGAVAEAQHVFIKNGLLLPQKSALSILEIGMGTGLNTVLTALEVQNKQMDVEYFTLEKYPITPEEIQGIDYPAFIEASAEVFEQVHSCPWGEPVALLPGFSLTKIQDDILDLSLPKQVDVIYFDAFAPEKQPKMWTETVFQKMHDTLAEGGHLTTYCAKGVVKRTLQSVGFRVEKVAGPPGKREMILAHKEV